MLLFNRLGGRTGSSESYFSIASAARWGPRNVTFQSPRRLNFSHRPELWSVRVVVVVVVVVGVVVGGGERSQKGKASLQRSAAAFF